MIFFQEAERQRRAMLFGGSSTAVPAAASLTNTTAPPPAPDVTTQLTSDSDQLIAKVLADTQHAEEEDHRRVAGHHDFLRQQTTQAVQLQHKQAGEFLRQYLAENKKQLDAHLVRLRSGFPLGGVGLSLNSQHGGGDDALGDETGRINAIFGLEKKVEILERRLEDKDGQLAQYGALVTALEDQHREELRELRVCLIFSKYNSSTVFAEINALDA